ncbi:hypothetical protein GQ53DRAFT_743293 [Thozetella sp. PMI_491]|nr:hypothetical protein GQ53DRAFT_743293 [Thozetella sp. PMI_491]
MPSGCASHNTAVRRGCFLSLSFGPATPKNTLSLYSNGDIGAYLAIIVLISSCATISSLPASGCIVPYQRS